MKKGEQWLLTPFSSPPSLYCTPISAPDSTPCYFHTSTFPSSVLPPLQEALCRCPKHECQVRSKEAILLTSPTAKSRQYLLLPTCLCIGFFISSCLRFFLKHWSAKVSFLNPLIWQMSLHSDWHKLWSELLLFRSKAERWPSSQTKWIGVRKPTKLLWELWHFANVS